MILLDQREVAQILKISERTLERHRTAGTGPRFCQLGRLVRYRGCDLEEWVRRSLRGSTSEILNALILKSAEKDRSRCGEVGGALGDDQCQHEEK